jgi:hypothetical protein
MVRPFALFGLLSMVGCAPAATIEEGRVTAPLVVSANTAVPSTEVSAADPSTAPRPVSDAWIETAMAAIRVDRGKDGGMRGCKGELTTDAKGFFRKIYEGAAKCAAAKAGLRGAVVFHSTLEEGGGLSEFSVLEDGLSAPEVITCIQEFTFTVEFPRTDPKTPCVQLVHPLAFP